MKPQELVLQDQLVEPQDDARGVSVPLRPLDSPQVGPWLTCTQAAAYVPCKSVNAFYVWRKRHGIVFGHGQRVARADIDRVKALRSVRVMHAHSLANLRKRVG